MRRTWLLGLGVVLLGAACGCSSDDGPGSTIGQTGGGAGGGSGGQAGTLSFTEFQAGAGSGGVGGGGGVGGANGGSAGNVGPGTLVDMRTPEGVAVVSTNHCRNFPSLNTMLGSPSP